MSRRGHEAWIVTPCFPHVFTLFTLYLERRLTMKKSMKIRSMCGERFKAGGRLYYLNSFGQGLYGTILGFHDDGKKQFVFVQRDEWPTPEAINLDDYVRTAYFPPGNDSMADQLQWAS